MTTTIRNNIRLLGLAESEPYKSQIIGILADIEGISGDTLLIGLRSNGAPQPENVGHVVTWGRLIRTSLRGVD